MSKQNETQGDINKLKELAEAEPVRRKSLLTPKEYSVVFGIVYAALMTGLTLLLDLIPVPDNSAALWITMLLLYAVMISLSILIERQLKLRFQIRRTLFYGIGQCVLLAGIIALIVIGARSPEPAYESGELAWAMALVFTEIVLLLYHLVRAIVLAIRKSRASNRKSVSGRKSNSSSAKKKNGR